MTKKDDRGIIRVLPDNISNSISNPGNELQQYWDLLDEYWGMKYGKPNLKSMITITGQIRGNVQVMTVTKDSKYFWLETDNASIMKCWFTADNNKSYLIYVEAKDHSLPIPEKGERWTFTGCLFEAQMIVATKYAYLDE